MFICINKIQLIIYRTAPIRSRHLLTTLGKLQQPTITGSSGKLGLHGISANIKIRRLRTPTNPNISVDIKSNRTTRLVISPPHLLCPQQTTQICIPYCDKSILHSISTVDGGWKISTVGRSNNDHLTIGGNINLSPKLICIIEF